MEVKAGYSDSSKVPKVNFGITSQCHGFGSGVFVVKPAQIHHFVLIY